MLLCLIPYARHCTDLNDFIHNPSEVCVCVHSLDLRLRRLCFVYRTLRFDSRNLHSGVKRFSWY
jgi:hypothetical protein